MDTQTEARIVAASQDFMGGAIDAGELLDRTASALWGEGSEAMAQTYEALPGGDGGAWVGEPAPRHLQPVAPSGHTGMEHRLEVRSTVVHLDAPHDGFWARMRLNPRRSTIDLLGSGETRKVTQAISRLILEWQFWDEDGQPIEMTPENVYDLPDDLLGGLVTKYFASFRGGDDAKQGDEAGDPRVSG